MHISAKYSQSGMDPGFGRGGGAASENESCWCSGVQLCEWSKLSEVGEAFEFLMFKYAFSNILETLFLSFLTSTSRPKIYNLHEMRNDMWSEVRLENVLIVKNSKIIKKKKAEWSKAKKIR